MLSCVAIVQPWKLAILPAIIIAQICGGEDFGKFEPNAIHQYFTQPNSRFTKVANQHFPLPKL